MKIKDFASSRNITQAKAKELSQQILGKIPVEFSEDDLRKLDTELGFKQDTFLEESQLFLRENQDNPTESKGELSVSGTSYLEPEKVETLSEAEESLKKDTLLFVTYLKQELKESKRKADETIFQLEQAYYNKLKHYCNTLYEDGRQRVRTNTLNFKFFASTRGLTEEKEITTDSEMNTLLVEALEFFNEVE